MKNGNRIPGKLADPEKRLRDTILRESALLPGAERLARCLQCGRCTGSCPVSYAMDVSPRQLIGLFRAGQIEDILKSRTIWICASCYMCTTRCPQNIKITDFVYALKRAALDAGVYPDRFPVFRLSRSFVWLVNLFGRNQEMLLVGLYYLRHNPLALLRQLPLGWKLYRRGRLSLWPNRTKGVAHIRHFLKASEKFELPHVVEPPEYVEGMVGYGAVGHPPGEAKV